MSSLLCAAQTCSDSIPDTTLDTLITLGYVDIQAKYIDRDDAGRMQVRVHGNPLAAGQTMSSFVNTLPAVTVQEDEVSIEGRKGTIIELDGIAITIDEFKALPLDMVSRLEIVPQAEAKYGPTATGGVLRVVLRRQMGLLGTLTYDNHTDSHGMVHNQLTNTLLLRSRKSSFYNHLILLDDDKLLEQNRYDSEVGVTNRLRLRDAKESKALSDRMTWKYEFSRETSLQAYAFLTLRGEDNSTTSSSEVSGTFSQQTVQSEVQYKGYGIGTRFDHAFGNALDGTPHSLELNLSYKGNASPADETYNQTKRVHLSQHLNLYTADGHIRFSLPRQGSLSAGFLLSHLHDRDRRGGVDDADFSAVVPLDFTRTTLEADPWVSYRKSFGAFSMDAVLHYYLQDTRYDDHDDASRNFTYRRSNWHPRALLRWDICPSSGRSLQFSYRHTFIFANFNYYLPITQYISPNFYSTGNPRLKEERHNIFDLSYFFSHNIFITAQLQHIDGFVSIMTYRSESDPDVYYTSPANVDRRLNFTGIIGAGGYIIPKVWFSNLSLVTQYAHFSLQTDKVHSWLWMIDNNHRFTVTRHLGLSLTLHARSKVRDMGCEYGAEVYASPGLYLTMLSDRLSLNLSVDRLLHNTARLTYMGDGYRFVRKDVTSPTMLRATLTWTFSAGRKIQHTRMQEAEEIRRSVPRL